MWNNTVLPQVMSSTPTGRKVFFARVSVRVRRTIVDPYRVRSMVRVSVQFISLI